MGLGFLIRLKNSVRKAALMIMLIGCLIIRELIGAPANVVTGVVVDQAIPGVFDLWRTARIESFVVLIWV